MSPATRELVVDIVNPTNAPIILLLVRIAVSGGKTSATGFPRNRLLIPGTPLPYRAYVELTAEQATYYRSGKPLVLQVEGSIIYIDSLKDEWEQRFSLMLACHQGFPKGPAVSDYTHTLHDVTHVKGRPLWRTALNWYLSQIEAMKSGESKND
jgi:hypothetical protein